MSPLKLLRVSRPRFWIYVLGPLLVGAGAIINTNTSLISWQLLALALYFTLPANLLIYGVNDIFDYESDKHNAKKQGYEELVEKNEHRLITLAILATNLPFLLLLPHLEWQAIVSIIVFLLLGIFYSAPPIRAKTKPFLDSASNILYMMPGLAGFFVAGGSNLSPFLVIAAGLWCMAMHAYSAAPDVAADNTAGMNTIATTLEEKNTVLLCLELYVTAFIFSAGIIGFPWMAIAAAPYIILMGLSYANLNKLKYYYRLFPYINTAVGMYLFFLAILK